MKASTVHAIERLAKTARRWRQSHAFAVQRVEHLQREVERLGLEIAQARAQQPRVVDSRRHRLVALLESMRSVVEQRLHAQAEAGISGGNVAAVVAASQLRRELLAMVANMHATLNSVEGGE